MTGAKRGDHEPVVDELVKLDFEVDPEATLSELRHGPRDPTIRFEHGVVSRALRTAAGPATTRLARPRDARTHAARAARAGRAAPLLLSSSR